MARAAKKPGTDVAVLQPQQAGLPAFLNSYQGPRGTEDIESADITIPRILLGQSMHPQVKDGTVKEGALFLNITGDVLAEPGKPLNVVLLARGKEFILWRPRKDGGGGILARAKPIKTEEGVRYKWDKANTAFDVKVDGKTKATWKTKEYIDQDGLDQWGSEIPGQDDSGIAATAHHNFVVMLPDFNNMVAAVSLSKSQVKRAKDWNALLKLNPAPIFARIFTLTSVDEHNDQGDFKNYDIKPAGFVTAEAFKSTYAPAAQSFVGKKYEIDQTEGQDAQDERL